MAARRYFLRGENMIAKREIIQKAVENNIETASRESLRAGDQLKRHIDGEWYPITDIQEQTDHEKDHATQLQFCFGGFRVWQKSLHEHFIATFDKFLVKRGMRK